MQAYCVDAVGIPKNINMLEDTQKKAKRASLPSPTLVIIITKSVL